MQAISWDLAAYIYDTMPWNKPFNCTIQLKTSKPNIKTTMGKFDLYSCSVWFDTMCNVLIGKVMFDFNESLQCDFNHFLNYYRRQWVQRINNIIMT